MHLTAAGDLGPSDRQGRPSAVIHSRLKFVCSFTATYEQQLAAAWVAPQMKHMKRFVRIAFLVGAFLFVVCPAYGAECAPTEAIEAFESARAHKEAGRFGAAIANMERAVAIYPDFTAAWYELYDAYRRADRLDDAIEALEQLNRIDPGAPLWRGLLALHRADAGIPPGAVEALGRCRRSKPGSNRAIAACEEAVELHSDYADARYFLGVNYIYAGDEESAKRQLATFRPGLDRAGLMLRAAVSPTLHRQHRCS